MAPRITHSVVFDLDGTLFDSLPCVLKALRHAVEPFEARSIDMEIFPLLGGPPDRFMTEIVHDPDDAPEALRRLAEYFQVHGWEIGPFQGSLEMLHGLRQAGVKLGIWTGRDRVSTVRLLRDHKLELLFDVVVCGDDFPTHKPDPLGMEHIRAQLGVSIESTLFVGDSDVDAQAGKSAGVRTLIISHGRQIPADLEVGLWYVAKSASEAYRITLAWGSGDPNPFN